MLVARSVSSVQGVVLNSTPNAIIDTLDPVGDSYTLPSTQTYRVGFASSSSNTSANRVDIALSHVKERRKAIRPQANPAHPVDFCPRQRVNTLLRCRTHIVILAGMECCDNRQAVVGRRSSVVGRRSSVVGRRSSVVGRPSSEWHILSRIATAISTNA
jgi:hypothetical protein